MKRIINIGAAAGAVLFAAAGCSPEQGRTAQGAADPRPLKMMSYNIRHCYGMDVTVDVQRVTAVINAEKPDIVGLQEIDRKGDRVNGVDQPAELGRLCGMHPTFAKTISLPGNGEYGVMVLSREKPLKVGRIPLPGEEPRMLLLCEFRDMVFGTTHLSVANEKERLDSIDIIRRSIAGFAPGKPVFLTGDWNSTPDSKVLQGMREFMSVISDEKCCTYHGGPNLSDEMRKLWSTGRFCIDYIAVDRAHAAEFSASDARVIDERVASDHAPVVVTVAKKVK
ncbi:MAG: endonuclease/exonuclease/phosphatase family protein [Kiritimatiellae bacterium]|nr:endonuclease/exonuclease/phosphatase family protein [Kiritimatiellia bacterium]